MTKRLSDEEIDQKFEVGKEYTTRDGTKARVYAVDCGGLFPIHGATEVGGLWHPSKWAQGGLFYSSGRPSEMDLMLPKLTKTRYMFLYADGRIGMSEYPSLYRSGCEVVATAVVELKEGEFGFELPLAGVKG